MNPTAHELALIAGGFGIVGAILGALVTYRLSIRLTKETYKNAIDLMQRQELDKAASIFRDTFLPETTFLKHEANIGGLGTGNELHEILRTGYLRQLKALEVFKDYLSPADRKSIYLTWDEYCHPNGIPQDKNEKRDFKFNDYMSIEKSEGTDKAKEIALQKINKILEFANFK